MKPLQEFLTELAALDIKLWLEDDRLRCYVPQGILTPEIQTDLKKRKGEIIKFFESDRLTAIPQTPRSQEPLPLSWAQERLWFLDRLEGKSSIYNIPAAVRIVGDLDTNALQQALASIVRRHEVLRTSFSTVNGIPTQAIDPEATIEINWTDLQQLEITQRENAIIELGQREATTPFDLENASLIRCSLLQLSTSEYVLLLTMHHIISDGWSMGVFIGELSSLYRTLLQGKESSLASLPIQYADFAVWQRQYLSGEVLETQLNYWKQQLRGAPDLLKLPTDYPRPSKQTYRGRTIGFNINTDLSNKLQTLSKESGTTLFMTLYAAFSILLSRYSGQSDILVGSPIANRNRSEIEGLIGFFVNTLVLRTNLEDNPSFLELLTRVRETTLKAYEHQDLPFEKIVEAIQPQRSLSYSPLFQVMFVLQNAPLGEVELPGVTLSAIELENTIAKFDLTLSITESDRGLLGEWEYNTDLFEERTMERAIAHFQNLLESIVANPSQNIGNLPLLSKSECDRLLVEWNDTAVVYPQKCIHQLFEEQVEKTPDAIAVIFEGEKLTYRELNQRANQLAHHLQSLGVKPEVLVGICLERSLEMVVGLLAILKAGGAYVPFDPNYPRERLSYMLEDAAVRILVTQSPLLASFPEHNAKVVCWDTDWDAIARQSQSNLDVGVSSANLAYVIYTSGSTGKPKGVMNSHRGIGNRLLWMQETYQLNSSDRILQKTPFSFDVSVWEFFWSLIVGASIVVAKPEGHKDANYLVNLIDTEQITTIHFVPSMLQVFLPSANRENCSSLKRIFSSGEALPFPLCQQFFSQLECQLHNLYGPTEAAIDVTFWQCQPQSNLQIVPIGRPIANTQIYILDSHRQPVPIGVPGELYIGGDGLARGYLNRPQLTSEKFIKNPFPNSPSSKLYKTGDLARYLKDGNIEFLGRIDNQVKIRGFRIELGEIEAVLTSHPHVEGTVVMAREENTGNKRLVAYIVADSSVTTKQLRDYLKTRLPNYTIPSAFVTLDSFPLTPNGKIDRQKLSTIDTQIPESKIGRVAPRNLREELLAQIWSQVLGVERVGINDNFFELGGDSLLVVRVLAEIEKLGLKLSLKQLYENQTIQKIAEAIEDFDLSTSRVKTEPFSLISEAERSTLPLEVEDAYPLTLLQQGMIFHSEYSPDSAVYHDVFTYHLKAPLKLETFRHALEEIVARHPILRTSIILAKVDRPIQLVHSAATVELTVEDLSSLASEAQEKKIATWIEREKLRPFLWEQSPLTRFHLHQRGDRTFNLTFSFHHAILDGWSVATLMTELFQQYFSLLDETTMPLPAAPNFTFRDYVAIEREILQSQAAKEYWHKKLADFTVTKLPHLPEDRHHSSIELVSDRQVKIDPALSTQLKQTAIKAGVPLKSVLLATHLRIMSLLSDRIDITTGLVTHGRPPIADSHLTLGLFLNTIPVRMKLSGGTWIDLIEQTFDFEREALPFQQYPYAQLQQEIGLGQPLFEAIFNYVNFHVYQNLSGIDRLEFLGGTFFEQTNFTFVAQFSVNPIADSISLNLIYNQNLFNFEQIEKIAEYYHRAILAIATEPQERYEGVCLSNQEEYNRLFKKQLETTNRSKIDLAAFPKLERNNAYIPPRTQNEKIIANLFAEVLNIKNIGINDNFVELGGNSLLATQIVFLLRKTFLIDIPMKSLFEQPTLASLAKTIVRTKIDR